MKQRRLSKLQKLILIVLWDKDTRRLELFSRTRLPDVKPPYSHKIYSKAGVKSAVKKHYMQFSSGEKKNIEPASIADISFTRAFNLLVKSGFVETIRVKKNIKRIKLTDKGIGVLEEKLLTEKGIKGIHKKPPDNDPKD